MLLQTNRLTRRFKEKTAVDDFTANFAPGVYGLLGPNGAGKTTLIRMLAGILQPSGGQVLLDETPMQALGENYRARLGYLPQHFGYYPSFTALDFLLYMGAVKGLPKPYTRLESTDLLDKVGLTAEANKKIKTFSGGMRQRLGIAQAMLGRPDILLLDEPTAGLDPKERIRFRNMITDYAKERIVLLSTHIVSDVESAANSVLVLKKGRLLHQGAPADILQAVEGRVWECTLPLREAEELSLRMPTTSFRHEGTNVFLRVVSSVPPCAGARPISPSLEDLYLYYFADEEDAPNDAPGALRA